MLRVESNVVCHETLLIDTSRFAVAICCATILYANLMSYCIRVIVGVCRNINSEILHCDIFSRVLLNVIIVNIVNIDQKNRKTERFLL